MAEAKVPMISIDALKPVVRLLEPLTIQEAQNLKSYLHALHGGRDTRFLSQERFFAFTSALEALAYRRGAEMGDEVRLLIHTILHGPDDAAEAALKPPK
jgi:hypothetical protein